MHDDLNKDLMAKVTRAVEAEELLAQELERYAGEWVAVSDHLVVAHAATLDELLKTVDVDGVDGVFQVAEHATASFF